MDIVFNLVLFVHLVALVVGAATNVVMPMIGARMAGAGPDLRAALGGLGGRMSRNARLALGVLVVTGVAMVALRHGTLVWSNPWFVAKMALLGVLLAAMIVTSLPRMPALDPRLFGLVARVCLLGIVFCSVMAFN